MTMVDVPAVRPEIEPVEEPIVATPVLLLVHVPAIASDTEVVKPEQTTGSVGDIGDTGLMVAIVVV